MHKMVTSFSNCMGCPVTVILIRKPERKEVTMDGKKNKKTKDGRKRPKSQEESRASGRANRDKSSEMQVRPPEQVCFMLDQNRECICRALDERKRLLEQFVQDSWPERSKDSRGSLRVSQWCGGSLGRS